MAENILNIDPAIDLKQCLLWQYQNSARLKSLILSKEDWYQTHQAQFWQDWYDNVFNIDTANDFGLSVWGQILQFSRNVTAKDGSQHYLTTEQYSMILKGQVLRYGMGASAPEINNWLATVFAGKGAAYCIDTYDMNAIPFVFRAEPTDEIKWLLGNIDFFPRPAGVGYQVRIIPTNVFGFNGSGLQPFNQGVFANDYSEELQPADPDMYQFSINAPASATVTINNEVKRWALIERGESIAWSVTQPGYVAASGSGTMQEDTSIDISSLTINNTSGEGTTYINDQEATGAFFITGTEFQFSYSVGLSGYIPLAGTGSITNSRTISISRLLIKPTPASATVTLNGQTARGAFFISGNIFEYSYLIAYPGMTSISDSGYVTENAIIEPASMFGEYKVSDITTSSTGGIETIGSYIVPFDGSVDFVMAAEAGHDRTYYTGAYGAKASVSSMSLRQGDVMEFVKINGNYGMLYEGKRACGGCGIALYVNDRLKLVIGGGGSTVGFDYRQSSGGGGYVGGYVRNDIQNTSGFSISGARGDSKRNSLPDGDGGAAQIYNIYSYGGSGYNALASGVDIKFEANQGVGFINLTYKPE